MKMWTDPDEFDQLEGAARAAPHAPGVGGSLALNAFYIIVALVAICTVVYWVVTG
jgi:hypothetical protein